MSRLAELRAANNSEMKHRSFGVNSCFSLALLTKRARRSTVVSLLMFGCLIICVMSQFSCKGEIGISAKVKYLTRSGEIRNISNNNEIKKLLRIDSFCTDDANNLYIADSGWNALFKLDSDGQFVASTGKSGQGLGELMAGPMNGALRISFGNDKRIYLLDGGNKRINILDDMNFIAAYSLPKQIAVQDVPIVNSKGTLYIALLMNDQVIQFFDKSMRSLGGLFDSREHFQFPLGNKPPERILHYVGEHDLKKVITKNDNLYILSNYTMKVLHYNDENVLIDQFSVKNDRFLSNFKKRVKAKKRETQFICPFYLFLDTEENLCLGYFNSDIENYEIYRYSQKGVLIDVLKFPDKVCFPFCSDNLGNIYALSTELASVFKYKI